MRITEEERAVLLHAIQKADPDAKLWLFGSRVDDTKRGGDIDVAVLSTRIGRQEQRTIRRAIEDALGEQRIDLVVSADGQDPFFRLAIEKGIRIDE
uniref:Nucleotidyltransferase domain-containing protein n=1 Tax=Gracilinema caldarium TaxID=215591 RepID=A0A7C3ECQ3_9SPIR